MTDKGIDLLRKLLDFNPHKRLSAEEALKHEYFLEEPAMCPPYKFFDAINAKWENQKAPRNAYNA